MSNPPPTRGAPVVLGPPGPEPTDRGRFGEFGGRFVPETLVPALESLEAAFRQAWADDRFRDELAALLTSYAGRPTPVTECHRLSERLGLRILLKREDLTHTGSHKINNVLGQALLTRRHGQDPGHRRDGRRPARGGHRHRRRPLRARVQGVHGCGGRGAPGAQRVPHASPRCRGRARRLGQRHPQGRHQRSVAGLGGHRRGHPLLHRLGGGPPSLPVDGAGVPAGRGRRGPGAVPRPPRRSRPRVGRGLRRRGLQRHRHLRRLRRHQSPPGGRGSRRVGLECGRHGASITRGVPGCAPRRPFASSSRTRTARSSRPTRSAPGSTIPASVRSMPPSPPPAGPTYASRHRRPGPRRLQAPVGHRGDRPRARTGPRHRRGWPRRRAGDPRRARPCSSPFRAGATRTRRRSPSCLGEPLE